MFIVRISLVNFCTFWRLIGVQMGCAQCVDRVHAECTRVEECFECTRGESESESGARNRSVYRMQYYMYLGAPYLYGTGYVTPVGPCTTCI